MVAEYKYIDRGPADNGGMILNISSWSASSIAK